MPALKLVTSRPLPDADIASLADEVAAFLLPMNENFNSASTQLCHAVGKIETIVNALGEVTGMLDGGVGSDAISGLHNAAISLLNVRDTVHQRSGEIASLHEASREIRTSIGEVQRCLQVLDIYGMNVKITASGLAQFMDFADAMRVKLGQGEQDLRGLEHMLEALAKSLHDMGRNDRLLDLECSRVFPQVPDALLQGAADLQAHQGNLGQMARLVSATATAIQTELHGAISAIQIGDRVRQRFEHVQKGLGLIEGAVTGKVIALENAQPALAVLAALSDAATAEYVHETAELAASVMRLRAQCDRLGDLAPAGSDEGDIDILGRIEASVGEARAMLGQLGRANSEGMATLAFILETVEEVTRRARSIAMLRLDVQYMAINIGLSCRTAQGVGRPVMVIANEIRTYSERLDAIAETILKTQDHLSGPCHRLQERSSENAAASGELLARFLATIADCNQAGRTAMAMVVAEAQELRAHLASAMSLLEEAAATGKSMRAMCDNLRAITGGDASTEPGTVAAIQAILKQLACTYTMADERDVHNRSLGEGYAGIATAPDGQGFEATTDDDDDDGLF
ncbi:hypothetical protein [Novosphingobium sp. B1]|uniref:hypothetical protein n=1 Tax=Novosphingobium sp. B1 TaxID=1938756 RepID=UPI0009D8E952|nr:hypothetical protein [Novosphingobium sp. B1]SMC42585.1 hypothetical protein SAMN06272759_102372 [Novosphingobium sp. B1]